MKLKRKKPKIKQVMTTCSWCGLKISTLGKTIWSIVPPANSDTRKDGKDFMFILCSVECGDQLKETLEIEKDLGELILSAEHIY